jgi:GGDEF domain-containing protein
VATHIFCSQPGEIDPRRLSLEGITCSIGVAALHRHIAPGLPLAETKSALLRLSDTAMYLAKESGRDRTRMAPADSPFERLNHGRTFRSLE